MVRYTLHVPLQADRGAGPRGSTSVLHNEVQGTLSRMASGFTSVRAEGRWRDAHGAIVDEPIMLYMVDVPDDAHGSASTDCFTLRSLARYVKRELAQDAVYLTRQTIDTWLI